MSEPLRYNLLLASPSAFFCLPSVIHRAAGVLLLLFLLLLLFFVSFMSPTCVPLPVASAALEVKNHMSLFNSIFECVQHSTQGGLVMQSVEVVNMSMMISKESCLTKNTSLVLTLRLTLQFP